MQVSRGLRIGLTGGIGSGKSTVARMLAARGAWLIDADAISRSATSVNGSAIRAIASQFGPGFVASDGSMNRDAMRELVFSEPAARQKLEAIVHPLVSLEAAAQAEAAWKAGRSCTLFDIPLLVESGRWQQQLDLVLVIDCTEATQLHRVLEREAARALPGSGWTPEAIQRAIAGQASRASRGKAADVSIYNDGLSVQQLDLEVASVAYRFGL
jgi:dephospho-CoA kinase